MEQATSRYKRQGEKMSNIVKSSEDLAEILMAMPFGKLMDVATELIEMNEDPDIMNRDPKTPFGMAQTLYDWAESQYDE
jgi:hypothetical protein